METFLIGLALRAKVAANVLAECVNLTEIMVLKQEIRDFSYGTSSLETKFNISMNSRRSEGIKQQRWGQLLLKVMNYITITLHFLHYHYHYHYTLFGKVIITITLQM